MVVPAGRSAFVALYFGPQLINSLDVPLSINLIPEMEIYKEFTEWAVARGVKLNGIAIHRFPGRGLGIIAEKKLEVCEINIYAAFIQDLFVGDSSLLPFLSLCYSF
jgi:hypothetical protein